MCPLPQALATYTTRAVRPSVRARINRVEVPGLDGWAQDAGLLLRVFLGYALGSEWGHSWVEQRLCVTAGIHMRRLKTWLGLEPKTQVYVWALGEYRSRGGH